MAMPEEFLALAKKVNNWGRWGHEDEIGTLNFITDDVVLRARDCIKKGKRFSLALPLSSDGPQIGAIPGRVNPSRTMVSLNRQLSRDPDGARTSDDVVYMGLQCATHWDSLAHMSYRGVLYNEFPASSIDEDGAARCGVDKYKTLVTRGVLLDVARVKGVDRLEPGYAITPEDLSGAEAEASVRVGEGDIVLLRTGQMQLLKGGDKQAYTAPAPGPGMAAAEWFHDRDVAAVATDNLTFEVYPAEMKGLRYPVHLLHLVEMGMTQGQNFDLDELAADCAADGVYEFFLDASPQPFIRGLGSPVNPVAIK
ncbi:MAG: cyclase family protein [Actinomycetota bacterium]|nr:cyclase family protein [Actinomycetota bacterium]